MSDWISVKDRLPDKSDEYLTFNKTSIYAKRSVTAFDPTKMKWLHSQGFITHWMPLPNPPEVNHE